MSGAPLDRECVNQLQAVFGSISEDDCFLLSKKFGGKDPIELIQHVYEELDKSDFNCVEDLIQDFREKESVKQSNGDSGGSWMVAKSKSSSGLNKVVSNLAGRCLTPDIGGGEQFQSIPFSGTQNSVQILRVNKNVEANLLRSYLSTFMQDPELRKLFYSVSGDADYKVVILLRGASGSGKSTLAQVLWSITENGEICSADNYFLNRNGIYKFNRSLLPDAHEKSRNHCKIALARGDSPVIIDNTNTRVDEMLPYVELAREYDYDIQILEPKTEWKKKAGILAQKNVHQVPKQTIVAQLERFETTSVAAMKTLVDKQMAIKNAQRQHFAELEWDNGNAAKDSWRMPPEYTGASGFTSMMGAMSISSPTKQRASPTFSWTEPPPPGPSAILLSDYLVPDLKRSGSIESVPKLKRAGRRGASGNSSSESTTPVKTSQRIVFEDPAHTAFNQLRRLFPKVPKDQAESVFNLYEGDVEACAAALMEQGAEMTGTDEQPYENGHQSTNGAVDVEEENWNESSATREEFQDSVIPKSDDRDQSEAGSVESDDEPDSLEMVLPLEFANVLLSLYGHPDDENRSLSPEELVVKVPVDAAFEIYKSLYLNMHKTENETNLCQDDESMWSDSPVPGGFQQTSEEEFNEIAISLTLMELETSSGDPQLSNIIELEKKIDEQSKEIFRGYSSKNRTMAQNITFSMLKQEYPVLDPSVVEEVYIQSFLNADMTRAWLSDMYPQSKAELKASKTETTTSNWHLRYNPKDVGMYSAEDLREVQRQHDELEQKWTLLMTKMRECYAKCTDNSNCQIKAHYITKARTLSEEMKDLTDEMQYYKAIIMNARHKNDQILDLHGLKIGGAMRVLKEFLYYKEEEFARSGIPKAVLLIITGQGKHSRNGCPVLQPAVKNYLSHRQYKHHTSKPGTYSVILTRGSRPKN